METISSPGGNSKMVSSSLVDPLWITSSPLTEHTLPVAEIICLNSHTEVAIDVRLGRLVVTYVPSPCFRDINPADAKAAIAERIEARLTFNSPESSLSEGSFSPEVYWPVSIRSLSSRITCSDIVCLFILSICLCQTIVVRPLNILQRFSVFSSCYLSINWATKSTVHNAYGGNVFRLFPSFPPWTFSNIQHTLISTMIQGLVSVPCESNLGYSARTLKSNIYFHFASINY
jgi:hypothetical protein